MIHTPFLCLALAFLLAYLSKIPVGIAMQQEGKGYDNKHPRAQQARLTGWGARALAAHQNALEVLAPFGLAVLAAQMAAADSLWISTFSIGFVISRVFYHVFYLTNWDYLRSTVWFAGFLCIGGLFWLAI